MTRPLIVISAVALCACASSKSAMREVTSKPAMLATPSARIEDTQGTFVLEPNRPINVSDSIDCPLQPQTPDFAQAQSAGAHVVRVTYPGLNAPLYGVLAFCSMPSDFNGAASRSYRIEIPQSYVDATEGGRVSVVYEPYSYDGADHAAWALWLSRDSGTFGAQAAPASPAPAPSK